MADAVYYVDLGPTVKNGRSARLIALYKEGWGLADAYFYGYYKSGGCLRLYPRDAESQRYGVHDISINILRRKPS